MERVLARNKRVFTVDLHAYYALHARFREFGVLK